MGEETRRVLVDTYAIIADLTGQVTPKARQLLEEIRLGVAEGVLHYLIIYELFYHWRRGRLPFRDEEELLDFVNSYFIVKALDTTIAIKASEVKLLGDRLLVAASNPRLRRRRLSVADATTIAIAKVENMPIVTGDIDLSYVAKNLGVSIIW